VDVTIESRASGPLIATVITDSDRPIDQPEIQGIFVPRHGEAVLSVQVIERGWFQFFDAQGKLVFTDEFSEHDDHVVVPGVSPSKPQPTPSLDYDLLGSNNDLVEDCEGGGSLVGTVWENTVTALFVAGGIAFIWWLSRRKRRRAAH